MCNLVHASYLRSFQLALSLSLFLCLQSTTFIHFYVDSTCPCYMPIRIIYNDFTADYLKFDYVKYKNALENRFCTFSSAKCDDYF